MFPNTNTVPAIIDSLAWEVDGPWTSGLLAASAVLTGLLALVLLVLWAFAWRGLPDLVLPVACAAYGALAETAVRDRLCGTSRRASAAPPLPACGSVGPF